jgi:hypothetical protein
MPDKEQLTQPASAEEARTETPAEGAGKKNPALEAVKQDLIRIRKGIRITKITATRSIKSSQGDTFVGFSATWQSIQDDYSGPGADVMAEPEEEASYAEQGMPIKDAKIARHMLAAEADMAALQSARANNSISQDYYEDAMRAVKSNYDMLVLKAMKVSPNDLS